MLVPDPVKLTLIQMHKKMARGAPEGGYMHTAHLLAYCILGHDQFWTIMARRMQRPKTTAWKQPLHRATRWMQRLSC
ncbi:hypothetical protein LY56_00442 [Roseinatronobacter thiooxidans]|uniref:Uncharacterized protein n=1 Tax=Roseinatronobacter thiooxidans TaxID=121821 RepID=A0A2W7QTW0_9RHOB|nr:hypothetical protein LY56_00442 [Roseinatronobacter thiooxidans]